jgi:hypothetical protein
MHEEKVAEEIGRLLNVISLNPEEVGQYIATKEHRTLQQVFARVAVSFLVEEAKTYRKGFYDLRNEATVKLAHDLYPYISNANLPFI